MQTAATATEVNSKEAKMLNPKLRRRSAAASAADRGRPRHITVRHVGMIVVALATALTGVAIIAPGASAATLCVEQTFGESNTYQQCVRDEQILLNDLWYSDVAGPNQLLTVDGYYGPHTFSDVEAFQTAYHGSPYHLSVDGITGPLTWGVLCIVDAANGYTGAYWHDAGCTPEG
jgi:peptidoglycan hydrolase-like protein with peptidoglycan-binding domain